MSALKNLAAAAIGSFKKYTGDAIFLAAATASAAMVVNADGKIEDSEITAALGGLTTNALLQEAYKASEIEEKFTAALNASKTRAGKITLQRDIEALVARPIEQRQDIFLIAADTADDGGIGDEEHKVLMQIAGFLRVDGAKLLG